MDRAANIFPDLLASAVNEARDAILIADAQRDDFPLVYVNRGFESLTGYAADEAVGKSFHFLQRGDIDQVEADAIQSAISRGEGCVVTLRNYRKDGSMFWSETSISPVPGAGTEPTHFIGIQKDVTDGVSVDRRMICADALAGIANHRHFDQRLANSLVFTRRAHSGMSLLIIEVDFFGQFIERYGRSAADECLCRVGDCIAKSFVRMSDCVARFGDKEIAVVSLSFGAGPLRQYAQKLCEQVRALNIVHEDSPRGVVTVSIGGVHVMPVRDTKEEMLIALANSKLQGAVRNGRDCAVVIG